MVKADPDSPALPEGFTEEPSPIVSEAAMRRIQVSGKRTGPARLLVVLKEKAKPEALEALLEGTPRGFKRKAPGVYEADLFPEQSDVVARRLDLVALVDVASRFFGRSVLDPKEKVRVAVAVEGDVEKAKAALKSLGLKPGETEEPAMVEGEIAAAKLAALVLSKVAKAVEVKAPGDDD